jgi:hypothetical protein
MNTLQHFSASLFAFAATAFLTGVAHAQDFTYGGDARAFGMGGAGLALMHPQSGRANPASLAFENDQMAPTFPALGLRSQGPLSRDNASGYLSGLTGNLKSRDAAGLSWRNGSRDSEFGLNAVAGFRMGRMEIGTYAVAQGRLQPNGALRQWASNTPEQWDKLPADAKSDVYAAGYYTLPSVAYGQAFRLKRTKRDIFKPDTTPMAGIGLRVKSMKAAYSHFIADKPALMGLADSQLASEMNNNQTLHRQGIGADLGLMVRSDNGNGLSGGLVIANLVKPNFQFNTTDRRGNTGRVDLLPTTLSAGVGYQNFKRGTVLAADYIDVTGTGGRADLRLGGEQRLMRSLSVRAGYSSMNGVTYGVNFFGVDAAFGGKLPLEVVRTFRF